jgi:sugar lactone lactonase YvrE
MPNAKPKTLAFALIAALAAASSVAMATLPVHETATLHSFTDSDSVFPESVTVNAADGTFFVGSVKEGTIYKGQVGKPGLSVFSPAGADGRTMATGMFQSGNRLVVAGRQTGQVYVYDSTSGRLVSKLDNGLRAGQTFLNDTTFAADGSAYITDSVHPILYRAAPTAAGGYELQQFLDFRGTAVHYVTAAGAPGINVNGIVATPDGRYLVVAKRNENALFRIDLRSREVTPIRFTAGALETPDGMFLQGNTLYVAQNMPRSVAVLQLSADYSSAEVERSIANPSFAFPTSVARYQDKLLVVSAQFDSLGSPAAVSGTRPPVLPFWVSEVPLRQAGAGRPTAGL